ncbi:MAG TPA: histidine kinase [Ohtaekwangia sp.]|uniref:sensor histidine kinase n=1 Tax=Ohtaekwangia sp. TaxID=2066019 RepID=UPI002F933776
MNIQSKDHWFFRYKIYHLPFWFVYHCAWWTITIGSISAVVTNIFSPYSTKFLFYVVFQAIGVYFNLYFLIPRFLEKGHYVRYIAWLLVTIFCVAALIACGYYVSAWVVGRTVKDLYGIDPENYTYFFKINSLPSTMASMTLGMSVKLTKNWIQTRRREQALEKEKLETELKFLKSQFNPHFLFNTINSIFVLIHKNPMMASESLAKFSDLLRYQLYECNEHQIPLSQELLYLESFIELQKLRQDHNHVQMSMHIDQQLSHDLVIAPFVLMPFIENAFKHVSQQKDRANWIRMELHFELHRLYFTISNSVAPQYTANKEFIQHSGIGLKNVQRRLDLVYPNKHHLTINKQNDQFEVTLRLDLEENYIQERAAAPMR